MNFENIAYLTGIIATIVTGIYFVIKRFHERKNYYRQKLQNTWTNEGDVTFSVSETHFIDLNLKTNMESGDITGTINIRNIQTDAELKNISVNGRLKFRKGHLILCNVIHNGHYVEYGKIKIIIGKYGKDLLWIKQTGDSNYIPCKTLLWQFEVIT